MAIYTGGISAYICYSMLIDHRGVRKLKAEARYTDCLAAKPPIYPYTMARSYIGSTVREAKTLHDHEHERWRRYAIRRRALAESSGALFGRSAGELQL